MTNTKGKRRGTRYMFSRPFRKHGENVALNVSIISQHFLIGTCVFIYLVVFSAGPVPLSTYMRIYKKGDIVDIKVRSVILILLFFDLEETWCFIICHVCFLGYRYSPERNASQVLPWQNGTCVQRDPACCRHHCQQAGQVSGILNCVFLTWTGLKMPLDQIFKLKLFVSLILFYYYY